MQVPGGLIGQQQTRTSNSRPSHSYQLLETAGEPARINVLAGDHADAIQHVGHQRRAFRLTDVAIGKGNFEVLRHRQIVEQMELLENKADVAFVEFAALLGIELMDGLVEEVILTLPGAVIHSEDTEQK